MIPIRDHVRSRTFPAVNLLFIGLNLFVFVRQVVLPDPAAQAFTMKYAFIAERLFADPLGSWYTPVTTLFFHGGFVHFIGNMLFLLVFGDNVEDVLGHLRYLFFYLFAGVLSLAVQLAVMPQPSVPVIGASGSISAVLGAYIVLYPMARVTTLIPIGFFFLSARLPAFAFLGIWVLLQLFSGYFTVVAGAMDNVAYFAHIGGFLYGVLVALFGRRRFVQKLRRSGYGPTA